ncbi:MAG: acetyl-CoA carboxylase biotin carboxyl carrier protein [Trueperaceae bacterium]|nr:acetyl-CoA carboxylase biotin carboxyl carrier protein [Trueperaceae bacterium]
MDPREIKRLLAVLKDAEVNEFSFEGPDFKLSLKRGAPVVQMVAQAPVQAQPMAVAATANPGAQPTEAAAAAAPTAATGSAKLVEVTAPIVGTFYAAPSPDSGPFVRVGDRVKPGTVMCIIEAMKLMNEIEAEVSGTVREVLVNNDDPVEYGQALFRIEPD